VKFEQCVYKFLNSTNNQLNLTELFLLRNLKLNTNLFIIVGMSIRTVVANPEELLRASMQGDRKSQELLYKQFYGFAMGVCLRYTQSKDEAVEVVNDGFLKVFTKGEQYDARYPFKAWNYG
jgi:Sigma-70 region 2